MAELVRAGCEVSVVPGRDSRSELQRLRPRLAEVVRAGLERAKALESLSLAPARAIGLGDRLGSLEKDKDADLVFFDGDPLDPHSRIQRVMILGETVWEAQ
jgi:imidazolonepropionase-like amidohydrolase